jgi:hypothetical protein
LCFGELRAERKELRSNLFVDANFAPFTSSIFGAPKKRTDPATAPKKRTDPATAEHADGHQNRPAAPQM